MMLGGGSYAVSSVAGAASAATTSELIDRLEQQVARFDDFLATADDAVLVDYRREQLTTLSDKIEAANIPRGQKQRLQSTVSAAIDSNDRAGEYAANGNEADSEDEQDATDGQLTAFINSVKAQRGKKLDTGTADELLDHANAAQTARDEPLVRADDIQNRNAPTSSALEATVEAAFADVRETVAALEEKGYTVTLEYFHDDGPAINVNPVITGSILGALGYAGILGLKAAASYFGLKTLGAVGIITLAGWVGTYHQTALQLSQRFFLYTPNYRLLAARYFLDKTYEQTLENMEERIEGNDSALENAIEEVISRIFGGLVPGLSTDEAGVLVEYISELDNQFVTPTVVQQHICPTIENEDHRSGFEHNHSHDCVGERYEFTPEDEYAYSWVELSDVPPGTTVSWTWTGPNGELIADNELALPDPRNENKDLWDTYFVWMWVPIAGTSNADLFGDWNVEFAINGELQFTDTLTLTD